MTVGNSFNLGTRASNDKNARGLLFEKYSNPANGETSSRIMWTEHNSTSGAAESYGISWNFLGDSNATFPSGAVLNSGNATWAFKRHSGSVNGNEIMSGSRINSDVNFHGNVLTTGQSIAKSFFADFNTGTVP